MQSLFKAQPKINYRAKSAGWGVIAGLSVTGTVVMQNKLQRRKHRILHLENFLLI